MTPSGGIVLSRRRLTSGVITNMSARVVGVATGVVVAATLARNLSHADFGRFSLMLSLLAMASAFGDLGLTSAATRQLSLDRESDSEILGALVVARGITGIAGASAVAGIALALDSTSAMTVTVPLIAATLLLSPLSAWLGVAQARLRLGRINGLVLLQSTLWTSVVLLLAAARAPLIGYAVGFFVTSSIYSVATWLAFRSKTRISFAAARVRLRQLVTVAWPVAVGGLFVTAYYRIDGLLLYHFKGPLANADYSAAYKLLDVLQFIPAALLMVVLPLLSATWRTDARRGLEQRARLFRLSLTITMAMSLPITIGGCLLAPRLIRLLYGADYERAAPLLAILLLAFPAISFGYVSVGIALASGRTRLYAATAAAAAFVNVVTNILLIPHFGSAAAAWITVATEFGVSTILLAVLALRDRLPIPWWSWSGSVAATLCMAATVVALKHAPLALAIIVPGCVYLVAALVLRAVSPADIKAATGREPLRWS